MPFVLGPPPSGDIKSEVCGTLMAPIIRNDALPIGIGYFEVLKKLRGGNGEESRSFKSIVCLQLC
jgi:hypothetical protein